MHKTIQGHPSVEVEPFPETGARTFRIQICAECESIRSILFLSKDRYFCTKCRAEGDARPTVIPLTQPGRRRRA